LEKSVFMKNEKKKTTISLCMIVKNEESCLVRCMKSVRDHVDEIIIVDTGSMDNTVEIAESYGARVYHHPWENDFSKHRNQSLSYATGDWIFQLDADEELFPEDGRCPEREGRLLSLSLL
jgi:glycosyltransferase involved in cell wall biosynthesis